MVQPLEKALIVRESPDCPLSLSDVVDVAENEGKKMFKGRKVKVVSVDEKPGIGYLVVVKAVG